MDEIIDIDDLRKLKLPELKALCKQNEIPFSGSKEVLVKRLSVFMGMDEDDEGVDEEALHEGVDEEALLEEEEEKEDDDEAGVSSSDDKEQSVEPSASNETTNDSVVAEGEEPPAADESPQKEPPPPTEKDKENDTGVSPTKKIKLIEPPPADPPKSVSQLTDAERLKLRAEKYGVSTSKGALSTKEARAARFGLAATGEKKAPEKKSTPPTKSGAAAKNLSPEDMEKMKQRSVRFGATVSSAMSTVDNAEKILKRKERFGDVAPTPASKSSADAAKEKRAARFGLSNAASSAKTASSSEMDELKKKRAERFKVTA